MRDCMKTASVMTLALSFGLIGCGGGGGGNMAAAINPPAPTNSTPPPTFTAAYDTGWTGPVGAPAPASFGSAPPTAQIATAATPTFDGSGGSYPSNGTFPVLSTAVLFSSSGLSAAPGTPSAMVTLTSGPVDCGDGTNCNFSYQLVVPALNVNENFTVAQGGLSYALLGEWGQREDHAGTLQSVTEFIFGYETPASAMPTSGQASYNGQVEGTVFASVAGHIMQTILLYGSAGLSVNFSSDAITGAFTQMKLAVVSSDGRPASPYPWNDVSVNASIATGTNKFSGTTAVTSAPQNPFSLQGSATGTISGGFYGPTAQNLGAIWTLSDGTASAIGGVAASR